MTYQHNVLDLGEVGARHVYCLAAGLRQSLLRAHRVLVGNARWQLSILSQQDHSALDATKKRQEWITGQ